MWTNALGWLATAITATSALPNFQISIAVNEDPPPTTNAIVSLPFAFRLLASFSPDGPRWPITLDGVRPGASLVVGGVEDGLSIASFHLENGIVSTFGDGGFFVVGYGIVPIFPPFASLVPPQGHSLQCFAVDDHGKLLLKAQSSTFVPSH